MRFGVISDIHANLEALEAVLHALDRARVDQVACLGDTVGYHASPNECVALVRRHCAHSIAGNHDRAAILATDAGEFPFVARRAVRWTAAELAEEHADYLRSLPTDGALDGAVRIVHAGLHPAPNDRFHVTTPARVARNLERLAEDGGAHVCFFGHTHRPVAHSLADGSVDTRTQPETVELTPERHYLINPGSVGQSRDGDWRASFAVYDSTERRVELSRVPYDRAACLARAASAGLLEPPNARERAFEAVRARLYDVRDLAQRGVARARLTVFGDARQLRHES